MCNGVTALKRDLLLIMSLCRARASLLRPPRAQRLTQQRSTALRRISTAVDNSRSSSSESSNRRGGRRLTTVRRRLASGQRRALLRLSLLRPPRARRDEHGTALPTVHRSNDDRGALFSSMRDYDVAITHIHVLCVGFTAALAGVTMYNLKGLAESG